MASEQLELTVSRRRSFSTNLDHRTIGIPLNNDGVDLPEDAQRLIFEQAVRGLSELRTELEHTVAQFAAVAAQA